MSVDLMGRANRNEIRDIQKEKTFKEQPREVYVKKFQDKLDKSKWKNYIDAFNWIYQDEVLRKELDNPENLTFWQKKEIVDKYVTEEQKKELEKNLLVISKNTKQAFEIKNDFYTCKGLVEFCINKKKYYYLLAWLKSWKTIERRIKAEFKQKTQHEFEQIFKQIIELVLYEIIRIYPNMSIKEATDELKKWYVFSEKRSKIHSYNTMKKENEYLMKSFKYVEHYYFNQESLQSFILKRLSITSEELMKGQQEHIWKEEINRFQNNVDKMKNLNYFRLFELICSNEILGKAIKHPENYTFKQKKEIVDTYVTEEQKEQLEHSLLDVTKYTIQINELKKSFYECKYIVEICIEKKEYSYLFEWIKTSITLQLERKRKSTDVSFEKKTQKELEKIYVLLIQELVKEMTNLCPEMITYNVKEELEKWMISFDNREELDLYKALKEVRVYLIRSIKYVEKYLGKKSSRIVVCDLFKINLDKVRVNEITNLKEILNYKPKKRSMNQPKIEVSEIFLETFQKEYPSLMRKDYLSLFKYICKNEILKKVLVNAENYTFLQKKHVVDLFLTEEQREIAEMSLLNQRKNTKQILEIKRDFYTSNYIVKLCLAKKEYKYLLVWTGTCERLARKIQKKEQSKIQKEFQDMYSLMLKQIFEEIAQELFPDKKIKNNYQELITRVSFFENYDKKEFYHYLKDEKQYLIKSLEKVDKYFKQIS